MKILCGGGASIHKKEGTCLDIFIIHDPVDKGKTAQKVRQEVPDAYFPMICAKPAGKSFVNKNITDVREDNWIIFSWDSESRFMEPIAGR